MGLRFVAPDEIRALKRDHLDVDGRDVLAFPIDERESLPKACRQLGDAFLCPQVVGDDWRSSCTPCCTSSADARAGDGGGERIHIVNAPRLRPPSLIESFNYAFEGIIHVLRTQRNMRIHFVVAFAVLIAALVTGVDKVELIALLIAIAFVLIAEMVNTAIEGAIDVATTSFDPMAKLAKDIAAGAVLIATVTAVAVGYLVFADRIRDPSLRVVDTRDAPFELTLIALVLTVMLVIAAKAYTGRGTPLRGGLPPATRRSRSAAGCR